MKITMKCKECSNTVTVSNKLKAVTCSRCTNSWVAAPVYTTVVKTVQKDEAGNVVKRGRGRPRIHPVIIKNPETANFPRGWHKKIEYIAEDGRKYSRGKLVTEE